MPGTAVIGASDDRFFFAPLPPGSELRLEPGAQGGFHIFVQLRISDDAREALGELALLESDVFRVSDDTRIARVVYDVRLMADPGGGFMFDFPALIALCPPFFPADETVRVEMSLGDPDLFMPLTATATVTPRCPTDPRLAEFCDEICRD